MVMWGSMMEGLAEGYKTGSDIYARSQEQKLKREEREDQKKEQEITRAGQMFNLATASAANRSEGEALPDINRYGEAYFKAMGETWVPWKTYGAPEQRMAKELQKLGDQVKVGKIGKAQVKGKIRETYMAYGKDNPEAAFKLFGILEEEERLAQYVKNKVFAKVVGTVVSGDKDQLYKINTATPGADPEMVAWEALNPKAYMEGLVSGADYLDKLGKAERRGRASNQFQQALEQDPNLDPYEYERKMAAAKEGDIFGDESLDVADGGVGFSSPPVVKEKPRQGMWEGIKNIFGTPLPNKGTGGMMGAAPRTSSNYYNQAAKQFKQLYPQIQDDDLLAIRRRMEEKGLSLTQIIDALQEEGVL